MSEGPCTVAGHIVPLEETHTTDVTSTPRPAAGAVPAFKASGHQIAPNYRLVQITDEIDWTEGVYL